MAVPAGAVYIGGVACTPDGAVYVTPTGTAAITGGTIAVDDGAANAPTLGRSASATGLFFLNSTTIGITHNGVQTGQLASSFWLTPTTINLGSTDLTVSRDGAGMVAIKGASNAAAESRVYAGNGGFISQVKSVTELLTIAAAATTVGATSIPAGAILLGVSVRVTTVIPTAATFTVTTTVGGTTLNTAAVSSAANSTDPGTAAGASYRAAATTVTITPNLTPGTATGVVRLQYYYLQVTPPTS